MQACKTLNHMVSLWKKQWYIIYLTNNFFTIILSIKIEEIILLTIALVKIFTFLFNFINNLTYFWYIWVNIKIMLKLVL